MITTLIADDEQHAIDRLKDLLSDHEQFRIVAEVNSGTIALEQMVTLKPQVAFLDINMPGISIFQTISSLQNPPLIIFQTAHSKYASDAFNIDALDYMVKPVSRERFAQAVGKIMAQIFSSETSKETITTAVPEGIGKITVKNGDSIKIIQIDHIQKICFEEGLSFIYTSEGRFLSDRSLNYYEEKFKDAGFFRSSRTNLVNLSQTTTIFKEFKGNYLMELKDGSRIEVSRRKALILKKTLDF